MLTGKQVRVKFARDYIIPHYIDAHDANWLGVADQLLTIFRARQGISRGELETEIDELFGSLSQPQIHQGIAKLLEDRCEFEMQASLVPEEVRAALFTASAKKRHVTLTELGQTFSRDAIVAEVAGAMNTAVDQIEAGMFADLKSEQRLTQFQDTTAERLLNRYNVALAQAVLMRSVGVEITLHAESPKRYRQLFRAIKFHRLICDLELVRKNTYRLRLDGPLSLFSATQKYGMQLAFFLPTLLLCDAFELHANLRWGAERKEKQFRLSHEDGLVTHKAEVGAYVPAEVPMFVELFRKKISDWELNEDAEIIPVGKSFWIPDYQLVHRATGQSVMLDILGFWRRSSVEKHLAMLREADRPFVLALSDQLKVEDEELEALPANIVRFRNLPLPDEIVKQAAKVLSL
ncbi:MAG: DUF790 family protein [Gemmataceae bacterium]|nr:DUF790 family protein [Gemmataceae bacterium]